MGIRNKLIAARKKRGLSQEEAATALEVIRPTISQWERGVTTPHPYHVRSLCEFYEVEDPAELDLIDPVPKKLTATEKGEQNITPFRVSESIKAEKSVLHEAQDTLLTGQIQLEQIVTFGTSTSIAQPTSVASSTPFDSSNLVGTPSLFRTDIDVLARLSAMLSKPSAIGKGEITYFNQQTRLYWRAREETALPATTLYTYVIRHIDDVTMLLARLHSSKFRLYLCETICRTVLLAGILLYDMGQYTKARQQYQIAFQAATEARNPVLQAIVWGWTSFTWTYTKCYSEALSCVQQACYFAKQTEDIMVQAWLGAIEAEVQAHLYNSGACLQSLKSMEQGIGASPSQGNSYLFEFNPVLLLGYKGVCLQQFYQKEKPATHSLLREAQEALELALASEAPAKRKLYYLNDLAGVYARQGEVEAACSYVLQSIPLTMQVGSGSKTLRSHLLQVRTLLQPYEQTSSVRALDEQIAPLFLEM